MSKKFGVGGVSFNPGNRVFDSRQSIKPHWRGSLNILLIEQAKKIFPNGESNPAHSLERAIS